jgi:hypothetical protein
MNQHLIAFYYLFTIILLFLAFCIIQAVPSGSPLNIDLYHNNMIISFAIYNPAEFSYWSNSTKETLEEPAEDKWNNNWNDTKEQDNNEGWNHADDCTPGLGNQPQLNTPNWIDWVFAYISLDQIKEITRCLFAQNFQSNYEAEYRISFRVVTPESSIPELEEEPVKEAQGQWEIGSNNEIPRFGNFT